MLKTYCSRVKFHVSQEASFGLGWTSLHDPASMEPYILHVSVLLSCQHTAVKPIHRALYRHWTLLMTDVREDKQHTAAIRDCRLHEQLTGVEMEEFHVSGQCIMCSVHFLIII